MKMISNELYHYGVDGQKWGVRKYQYEDGSLTPAGREHYGYGKGVSGAGKTTKSGSESTKSNSNSNSTKVYSENQSARKNIVKSVAIDAGVSTAALLGSRYIGRLARMAFQQAMIDNPKDSKKLIAAGVAATTMATAVVVAGTAKDISAMGAYIRMGRNDSKSKSD